MSLPAALRRVFVVNLNNGKVHSLSHEHPRCRLSTLRTRENVTVHEAPPKTTQALLYKIGLAIPIEKWPVNRAGAHKRKTLVPCVWCMAWFDEWGNEP